MELTSEDEEVILDYSDEPQVHPQVFLDTQRTHRQKWRRKCEYRIRDQSDQATANTQRR